MLARFVFSPFYSRLCFTLALLGAFCTPTFAQNAASKSAKKPKLSYYQEINGQFALWLKQLRKEALAQNISAQKFDAAMKGVKLNWRLPDLAPPTAPSGQPFPKKLKKAEKKKKRQAEFDVPSRYFPEKSLQWIVKNGKELLVTYEGALKRIEKEYGVHRTVILAVWGRETAFGKAKLRYNAIHALTTLAFMGRRKEMFHKELLNALRIYHEGHIDKAKMRSSWAGAMGHTQFMPTDFLRFAVDFTGDGKKDIWGTVPDALASTAFYLRSKGWDANKTWGYEVILPPKFDCRLEDPRLIKPIKDWITLGIKRTYDRKFTPERLEEPAQLLLPGGPKGPAFLIMKNFEVIKTYNPADLYALYVGHVADRIGHNRPFAGKWARVEPMSRAKTRKFQGHLARLGFNVGKIDGIAGRRTRSIIGHYEKSRNLPLTCLPSHKLHKVLAADKGA